MLSLVYFKLIYFLITKNIPILEEYKIDFKNYLKNQKIQKNKKEEKKKHLPSYCERLCYLLRCIIQDRLCYVIVTHNPCFLSFKNVKIYFSFTQNVLAGLAGAGLDLLSARDVASPSGTALPQLRETAWGITPQLLRLAARSDMLHLSHFTGQTRG